MEIPLVARHLETKMMNLVILIFSVLVLLYFRKCRYAPSGEKRLPPSPWKLPIIGNLHQIGPLPHRSLRTLSEQYGRLLLLQFGSVPVLVVSSAEAACEIMKSQDLLFANRPYSSITDKLFYGNRDVAFAPYGEYWRQIRSISVLHLLSNRKIQSFRHVREDETLSMIEKIRRIGISSSTVNLSAIMVSLANDVICRVALGKKYGEDGHRNMLGKLLRELVGVLGTINIADFIPWLSFINYFNGLNSTTENIAKQLDEVLHRVLEEGKEKKHGEEGEAASNCFIDILLEFQRENTDNIPVEDETIKAIILDMFVAGTDTTSTALEWAMSELLKNPRTLRTLQNEVRNVAGKSVTEEDLQKMPYLKAVIKETLRLHPPVPLLVQRESTQDTQVMGYHVPSKTRVIINAWAIGRDPHRWENADEFRPERFEASNIDFKGLHFELIPFGAGRRGCPGTAFAEALVEIALAKLVHRFDFVLAGGKPEDLDLSEVNGMTVRKRLPLVVDVIPHS